MAFLKYRGSSAPTELWTSTVGANAPLTNLDIDTNFASLNAQKIDVTGGTVSSGTLLIDTAATFQAELKDDKVLFVDNADTSKKLAFQLSGITTANTRTLTIQDKDGTIAVTSDLTLGRVTGATTGSATATDQAISITNTTDSTSTSTGALKISGGVGIAKNLYVGGDLNIASGKSFKINSIDVLSATTLGSAVVSSSLTSVGTIGTGTWQGTSVKEGYGGTGQTTYAAGDILYASAANTLSKLAKGVDGQVLKLASGLPAWAAEYTLPVATTNILGGVKLGSDTVQTVAANAVTATASRTYAVQLNASSQALVNVPWTDTDTTYSAGTGLTLTGTTFSVNYGTTATTACVGNDSRLSDNRTPTAHVHDATHITTGTIATERLGSGTASSTTFLRGDQTWATVTSGASISDDTTTNADYYPLWATSTSGTPSTVYVSSSKLKFNPSTGQVSATNFNSLSDRNAKKDLVVIENALDKVKQLTGYTYTLIENDQRSTGLISQDVNLVLPEATGTSNGLMNINYGAMMGLIVEAIKELDSKLDSIQKQINNK